MGKIICGSREYMIVDIPHNYAITPPVKGIGKSIELKIMQDFADLLIRGYKLLDGKLVPKEIHTKEIKYDIIDKEEIHDKNVQKQYLKETRKYWEEMYTFLELLWMTDFQFLIAEIGGEVSSNWYAMYGIIRGELPENFPPAVCFSIMIENVFDWKSEKYINRTVKVYFKNNPDSQELLQSGKIPDNLELYPEIGLTVDEYIKYAKDRCVSAV